MHSIFRESIALAVHENNSNEQRAAGIASVTAMSVLCFLFFPIAYLVLLIIDLSRHQRALGCLALGKRGIVTLIQSVAAFLYFYGDNIDQVIQRYGEDLGCDDQCEKNNRIAAVISLGVALILLHHLPPIAHNLDYLLKWEDTTMTSEWLLSLDMINIIIKVDAFYTVVVMTAETGNGFCGRIQVVIMIQKEMYKWL